MTDIAPIRRALISVSSKQGIVAFAKALADAGVYLLSTGGTARALREAGLDVTLVEDHTGFPEMLDGRVKTLHPKVHGGILGVRDNPEHRAKMTEHGIEPIDLVCIDLYPFERTIAPKTREAGLPARDGVTLEEAVEQIDIGGPSMLRSAAKNFRDVTVVSDPSQYERVLAELTEYGGTTLATRMDLSAGCSSLAASGPGSSGTARIPTSQRRSISTPTRPGRWSRVPSSSTARR
jgi:phosphoribosylaminoimidazolecarboxamide formyltransferase/IMP cyclohydrolase